MKFIKKHKYTLLVIVVFLVLFIFAFIGLKNLLIPDNDIDKYGDRLEGMEKYPISDEVISTIKNTIKETKKANDVKYRLEGKIMMFQIDVVKGTNDKSIETLGDMILSNLSDDLKTFYDVHLIITCNEDEEFIPKMATMSTIIIKNDETRKAFIW